MRLLLLTLLLWGFATADEELVASRVSDIESETSFPLRTGSDQCVRGRMCGDYGSVGCDENCTTIVAREHDCVFAATTFEEHANPNVDLWMNISCDESTYVVSFFGADNCTDLRTTWNRSLGTCITFSDIPNFVIDECHPCLSTGAGTGATVGIILGFILLIFICCGIQYGISGR